MGSEDFPIAAETMKKKGLPARLLKGQNQSYCAPSAVSYNQTVKGPPHVALPSGFILILRQRSEVEKRAE